MKSFKPSPAARDQVDENRHEQSASAWNEAKRHAVQAVNRQVPPDADARKALRFMHLKLKGAAIRWRGL
jgi:hypothetical protein